MDTKKSIDTTGQRDISVKAIEQWRAQLSMNDLPASARALYVSLVDCNNAQLAYTERYEILALLSPMVNCLTQSISKRFSHKEILASNDIAVADLINILKVEMLNGYKIIIKDADKHFLSNKKILISSVLNAMNLCAKILFNAFAQHRSPLPGIWLELHQLYMFAKEHDLAQRSLKKYCDGPCRLDTLLDHYKHYLLFSIANPTRLRKDQINLLMYATELWASFINLTPNNQNNAHIFIVDLTIDAGPKLASYHVKESQEMYYIDLDKLIARLNKLYHFLQTENKGKNSSTFSPSELALPPIFVELLLNTWSSITHRRDERKKGQGIINVCLGLSSSCLMMKSLIQHEVLNVSLEGANDVESIDLGNIPLPESPNLSVETSGEKHQVYTCEIVDESSGGFCLKWLNNVPAQLQCGELIALETITELSTHAWSIGTIRWLKTEEDHSILIGVQMISSIAYAVHARLADATTSHGISTLILPERPEFNKPMTIIVPPLPFKAGNEIEVEFEGQSYSILLQRNFSQSSLYQEFEVEFRGAKIELPVEILQVHSNHIVHAIPSTKASPS